MSDSKRAMGATYQVADCGCCIKIAMYDESHNVLAYAVMHPDDVVTMLDRIEILAHQLETGCERPPTH